MPASSILEHISSILFQGPSEQTFAQLVQSLGDGQLDEVALTLARKLLDTWPEEVERLAPRRLDWAGAPAVSLCTHLNWSLMPASQAASALARSPHVAALKHVYLGGCRPLGAAGRGGVLLRTLDEPQSP